jgi:deazaflavin-dependent oxidoreductase (nitroreductase family)
MLESWLRHGKGDHPMKSQGLRDKFIDKVRYFNKRVTNRITMNFAGRRVYAVVKHIGRRSGSAYSTPVLAVPTESGFVIPLPYGEKVDWCCNVLAAGGCTMQWQGKTHTLVQSRLVDPVEAQSYFPRWQRFLLRRVEKYIWLQQA